MKFGLNRSEVPFLYVLSFPRLLINVFFLHRESQLRSQHRSDALQPVWLLAVATLVQEQETVFPALEMDNKQNVSARDDTIDFSHIPSALPSRSNYCQ